ncbi:MAG TPA: outer membrane beta-barrel protein [Longimicrobiales bacterium]
MPRVRPFVLTAATLALLAAPAAAQRITSPYRYIEPRQYVSVFAGQMRTQTGVVGVGPKAGNIFGAQFGYRASGPFVIEVTLGYMPLQRTVRDTTRQPGDNANFHPLGTANQSLLVATAAAHFDITGPRTWHGFQPYAILGAGGVFGTTSQNGPAIPQDVRFSFGTSFAAQAGAGIEWYATRRLGLRVDGRGTLWKLHTPSAFLLRATNLPQSEWTQNLSLVGGLALHF